MKNKKGHRYQGFTLIELLISLTILSVISFISYSTFLSVRRAIDASRINDEIYQDMRGFLERLDVEISGAIYVRNEKQSIFSSERIDFDGEKVSNLILTTLSPQIYLELGNRGEIIRVEYSVERNDKNEGQFIITKKIFYNTLSLESFQEPVQFIVRDNFTSFQLRFFSDGSWFESWDTQKRDGLPERVELVFSLGSKKFREYFNVFISET